MPATALPVGFDPFDGTRGNRVAAEGYAALLGWRVIPLWWPKAGVCACPRGQKCSSPGKHPILPDWPKLATTDRAQVRAWWSKWPLAHIGLATGQTSGFVALDADPRHGSAESLAALISEHGPLPDSPISLTGGGGQHFLFAWPPDGIGNAANLAPGLDFRGDGGLIVAPPSVHASGQRYAWECAGHPLDVALPPMPDWLTSLVRRGPSPPQGGGQGEADPSWLAGVLAGRISEGGRNDTLARLMGYLLRRHVDARLAFGIISALNETTCTPPLAAQEVVAVARSIAARELARRGGGPRG